ncbi:NUDIX domain-containing protein [Candidatus Absconditicoccus praedator]|uniref:NUDIX domain-containing protein n=1 Tax=Candidatus Absconditicoccus praedator TaxID=2735562 RepID=UPI001E35CBC1|nr:NUDIX domain-containing protein [Candidatus Absconditicoccus praedator]UFX82939.1 NUDIX domain-containing protein [Candidatus Absconditicoccus praedator]
MEKHKSAGIIPIKDSKILLIKGWHGNWLFPKGHIEENESDIEAAKREFWEETGIPESFLHIQNQTFKDSYEFNKDGKKHYKEVVYFLAHLDDGFEDFIYPMEGEILDVKLFDKNESISKVNFDFYKQTIQKVI